MFKCFKGRVSDTALDVGELFGERAGLAELKAAGEEIAQKPHICEDTIKLAIRGYDERRAKVMEGWQGIVNPYRIRRDEALGVFLVERAVEDLPPVGEDLRLVFEHSWLKFGMYHHTTTAEYVLGAVQQQAADEPDIRWQRMDERLSFTTFEAAHGWLLQFLDPKHGTVELDAKGQPAGAAKAKPRKG